MFMISEMYLSFCLNIELHEFNVAKFICFSDISCSKLPRKVYLVIHHTQRLLDRCFLRHIWVTLDDKTYCLWNVHHAVTSLSKYLYLYFIVSRLLSHFYHYLRFNISIFVIYYVTQDVRFG